MRKIIKISTELYERMRERPLFFVKYYENISCDNNGKEYDNSEWQSVDKDLEIRFLAENFGQRDLGYCLCITEELFQSTDTDSIKKYDISFHEASTQIETDYITILNNCIVRSNDKEDKYAFAELLWFLDKQNIDSKVLSNAIRRYDKRTISFILNIFRRICKCLSSKKQNVIKSLFDSFGERYEVYMPKLIIEAFQLCKPSFIMEELNLFQLIDEVVGHELAYFPTETNPVNNNILLQLRRWLHSENAIYDYNLLKPIFSMVAEPIRLEIVKRYFHDIRIGNTSFNYDLVVQFRYNHFDEFIRYRYVIETPAEQIVLTVPLLCDVILTLYNSRGKIFQTFNSVLDFAMTRCDRVHPGVDFKLERFIPICKCGAVYNNQFKGFIDYQLIRKINKSVLTDSFLLDYIRYLLDYYGKRQQYPVCMYGDGSKIENDQFVKCSKVFISKENQCKTSKLECFTYKNYNDKWLVFGSEENVLVLNSFLAKSLNKDNIKLFIDIDLNMVSIDVFRNYILSLPSIFETIGNDEFIVHSYKNKNRTYELALIEQFSSILRMRILPQNGAIVGPEFDIFGFWKEQKESLSQEQLRNQDSPEYKAAYERYLAKETKEVYNRIVESLKKELNIKDYNGLYFEIPYKKNVFENIINIYYFKESFKSGEDISKHKFLSRSYVKRDFISFCAPEISKVNNKALDLPFFWCRGKECFHNNLERQTLSEMSDWHKYSLYHLLEIIGYPKLHPTEAGNEPDIVIRSFIAIINKVTQKFRRLKCHKCGHLMFTTKSSGYNRYNYYSCINPICPEVGKPIYLNYCYKCKKGLIDSRDTKRVS